MVSKDIEANGQLLLAALSEVAGGGDGFSLSCVLCREVPAALAVVLW